MAASSGTAAPGQDTTPIVVPSSAAAAGPATFRVLGGRAQGAMDIEMFMPAEVRIRQGDTIEWAVQGFESHTITFATPEQFERLFKDYLLPDPDDPAQRIFRPDVALRSRTGETFTGDGMYTNSGFIGVPLEEKYRLTFAEQGLFEYLCLVHPFTMRGTVSVDAPDATVDSPDTVVARGQADLERFVAVEKRALEEASAEQRSFPGAGGATVHRVAVGLTTPYGQVAVYVKPALDIKAGDTVIFANDDRDFHNVIFKGARELPPGVGFKVDPEGRGHNLALSKESAVAVDPPAGGFDDTTFLSSGSMGPLQPRLTWTVRFDTPGTYVYNCTMHVLAGMGGVINVR
jgi:plastocyanin